MELSYADVVAGLAARGIDPMSAVALTGGFVHEAPGRTPGTIDFGAIQKGGGPGRGAAQWGSGKGDLGDRFGGPKGLDNFARSRGDTHTPDNRDWSNPQTQMDFIAHELTTSHKHVGKALAEAKTLAQKAEIALNQYEAPAVVGNRAKNPSAYNLERSARIDDAKDIARGLGFLDDAPKTKISPNAPVPPSRPTDIDVPTTAPLPPGRPAEFADPKVAAPPAAELDLRAPLQAIGARDFARGPAGVEDEAGSFADGIDVLSRAKEVAQDREFGAKSFTTPEVDEGDREKGQKAFSERATFGERYGEDRGKTPSLASDSVTDGPGDVLGVGKGVLGSEVAAEDAPDDKNREFGGKAFGEITSFGERSFDDVPAARTTAEDTRFGDRSFDDVPAAPAAPAAPEDPTNGRDFGKSPAALTGIGELARSGSIPGVPGPDAIPGFQSSIAKAEPIGDYVERSYERQAIRDAYAPHATEWSVSPDPVMDGVTDAVGFGFNPGEFGRKGTGTRTEETTFGDRSFSDVPSRDSFDSRHKGEKAATFAERGDVASRTPSMMGGMGPGDALGVGTGVLGAEVTPGTLTDMVSQSINAPTAEVAAARTAPADGFDKDSIKDGAPEKFGAAARMANDPTFAASRANWGEARAAQQAAQQAKSAAAPTTVANDNREFGSKSFASRAAEAATEAAAPTTPADIAAFDADVPSVAEAPAAVAPGKTAALGDFGDRSFGITEEGVRSPAVAGPVPLGAKEYSRSGLTPDAIVDDMTPHAVAPTLAAPTVAPTRAAQAVQAVQPEAPSFTRVAAQPLGSPEIGAAPMGGLPGAMDHAAMGTSLGGYLGAVNRGEAEGFGSIPGFAGREFGDTPRGTINTQDALSALSGFGYTGPAEAKAMGIGPGASVFGGDVLNGQDYSQDVRDAARDAGYGRGQTQSRASAAAQEAGDLSSMMGPAVGVDTNAPAEDATAEANAASQATADALGGVGASAAAGAADSSGGGAGGGSMGGGGEGMGGSFGGGGFGSGGFGNAGGGGDSTHSDRGGDTAGATGPGADSW